MPSTDSYAAQPLRKIHAMQDQKRDPYLLTPGPLTTSATTKEAMLHDWGSRDKEFIAINRRVRERLLALQGDAWVGLRELGPRFRPGAGTGT